MTKNIGGADRIVRLVLAVIALIVAVKVGAGTVPGIIAIVLAVILAGTAFVRFCPIYRPFGISTNRPPD